MAQQNFHVSFNAPDDKIGAIMRYLYALPGVTEVSAVPVKSQGSHRQSLPTRILAAFAPGVIFSRKDVIERFPEATTSSVDTTLSAMAKGKLLNRQSTGKYTAAPPKTPAKPKVKKKPAKKTATAKTES